MIDQAKLVLEYILLTNRTRFHVVRQPSSATTAAAATLNRRLLTQAVASKFHERGAKAVLLVLLGAEAAELAVDEALLFALALVECGPGVVGFLLQYNLRTRLIHRARYLTPVLLAIDLLEGVKVPVRVVHLVLELVH